MKVEDLRFIREVVQRKSWIGWNERQRADRLLREEIIEMCKNPELEYWKTRRRAERTPPVGWLSDRLAESKSGKLRVGAERLNGVDREDIVRQILDLMSEGYVNVILESRT